MASMNNPAVIVCGGMLEEDFATNIVLDVNTQFVIGVDSGLEFLYNHGIVPDLIVGDFDSVEKEIISYYVHNHKDIPIHNCDPEKDASDAEIALELCINMGHDNIIVLGGTGKRLDHFWSNVQILKLALDAGVEARIIDSQNRIRLIKERFCLRRSEAFGKYFSLFPLGEAVRNLRIKGAKYPLDGYTLSPYTSRCVSNEFAKEEVEITFDNGVIVFMETKD